PDVFTPARFALAFVTDNSRAYDDFSDLRNDPSRYYELMWVLDGLFSEGGTVYHGSPVIMTGPDNKKHHIEMKTSHLDTRWLSFLCAAPFVLIQSAGTDDPYFARGASHRFSAAICSLILENKDIAAMMAGFFEDAVYHCGGMHDLIGLRICGNIKTTDDLEALFKRTTVLAEKEKLACAPELITAVFCDDKYETRTFTEEECIRALAAAKLSDK
ncbi:MAG: hypothetical protein ILP19_07820, partial [Oscillospiraceae bacterium]|nr:hypothetical protein [Oscillospiraceae bacterium]